MQVKAYGIVVETRLKIASALLNLLFFYPISLAPESLQNPAKTHHHNEYARI